MSPRPWPTRAAVAGILLLGISLGAMREFLFINLNYQLDHVARHTRFSYAHSLFIRWSQGMDLAALSRLKWELGALFTALFAFLCIVLARLLFRNWAHTFGILGGFLGFALLAVALHFASHRVPRLELISVQVSHMLQYPVSLLFVLFAGWHPRNAGTAAGPPA